MKRIIYLQDVHHHDFPRHYGPAETAQAIQNLIRRKLRWDNRTGRIHDNEGELERFSVQSDHVPHACEEDVMRWELGRRVNNEAGRIIRERQGN